MCLAEQILEASNVGWLRNRRNHDHLRGCPPVDLMAEHRKREDESGAYENFQGTGSVSRLELMRKSARSASMLTVEFSHSSTRRTGGIDLPILRIDRTHVIHPHVTPVKQCTTGCCRRSDQLLAPKTLQFAQRDGETRSSTFE